jgi:hypothetical protein
MTVSPGPVNGKGALWSEEIGASEVTEIATLSTTPSLVRDSYDQNDRKAI